MRGHNPFTYDPAWEVDKGWEIVPEKPPKDDRYPHECPACGGPAFVGLVAVECKVSCKYEYRTKGAK